MKNKRLLAVFGAILALGLGIAVAWFGRPQSAPMGELQVLPSVQKPVKTPRLAVVLDDWGQNTRLLPELKDFPGKLTVAVIPGLPHSRDCAMAAHDDGHEVIMHLPVEPLAKIPLAKGTLMVGMTRAQVWEICERHATSVPYMHGLNNHEGSKGSADPSLMAAVAGWLKSRGKGMYFLDSVTTLKSVIPQQAQLAGLPWARRRIFLDNVDEIGAIEKEGQRAVKQALKDGCSIAIGHPRIKTMEVLKKLAAQCKAQGVELVFASSLAGPDGQR